MIAYKPNKTLFFILILSSLVLFLYGLKQHTHRPLSAMATPCPASRIEGSTQFYAQYLEDYILSIIFKQIKHGTYIDIGASHPNIDSVTRYFYEQGWHGINIEPIRRHYLEFIQQRPNDINLNIGIADETATLPFSIIFAKHHDVADVLSTFDRATLERALNEGYTSISFPVKVKPLNSVLKKHPLHPIHFIKIDVEGLEEKVLKSIDLSSYRPWIFIIEAVVPRTFIRSDEKWKQILSSQGYNYAMFDGLNAYYVAKEQETRLAKPIKQAYQCAATINQKYNLIANTFEFGA